MAVTDFLPKVPTSRLYVGPHSQLIRNGITFNDQANLECYFVEDFTGFGKADLRVTEEENVQEIGGTPMPGLHGSRTMTMTGFIRCGDYLRVMEMGAALEDSLEVLTEKPMTIKVKSGGFFTQPDVTIDCRATDWIVSRKVEQNDRDGIFKRPFTVALRASDPRYYSVTEYTAQLIPTVISQLGAGFDVSFDLAFDDPMDPFGNPVPGGGNSLVVNNGGSWWARPILKFYGRLDGMALYNNTNGQLLRLKFPVAAGDWIELDVGRRKLIDQNGVNRFSYFDTTSDWLVLNGKRDGGNGDNNLSLAVSNFDGTGRMEVRWRHTWIGA